jgi:hypothetical protein
MYNTLKQERRVVLYEERKIYLKIVPEKKKEYFIFLKKILREKYISVRSI